MKTTPSETPKHRNTETPKHCLPSFASFAALCLAAALTGCSATKPLRGGKAFTASNPSGGLSQALVQGDNPSAPSRQSQETIKVRSYTLPPGSRVQESVPINPTIQQSNNPVTFFLAAPMPVVEREEARAGTELGAAQKDTAREMGAKLSSLKGLVFVGLLMFVFGIASFAWPPLKAIIGSVTTSAAIAVGGLAVAVGAWFLAHRHGRLHGQLAATPQYRGWPWN